MSSWHDHWSQSRSAAIYFYTNMELALGRPYSRRLSDTLDLSIAYNSALVIDIDWIYGVMIHDLWIKSRVTREWPWYVPLIINKRTWCSCPKVWVSASAQPLSTSLQLNNGADYYPWCLARFQGLSGFAIWCCNYRKKVHDISFSKYLKAMVSIFVLLDVTKATYVIRMKQWPSLVSYGISRKEGVLWQRTYDNLPTLSLRQGKSSNPD
jgi:hypothetical protein